MRKRLLAMAAGLALGAATITTAAVAAPHGGGHAGFSGGHANFGGGGHPAFGGVHSFAAPQGHAGGNFAANNWHGNGGSWHGNGGNWVGHRGGYGYYGPSVGAYAFGGYGPDYYDSYDGSDYAYDGSDGCYQRQLVQTAYGAQWQLVDVCQ
jgi:hypothetical protein